MSTERFVTTGYLELKEECGPMSDHIGLCDDDGMPFCLTGLLPFVGRGVRITVELEPQLDTNVSDAGNEPYIYQQIGMTPSGYTLERQRMREAARHPFQEHAIKRAFSGEPITPECFRCGQLFSHEIHIKAEKRRGV